MAKLRQALARYQAKNAVLEAKKRKLGHAEHMREQQRAAQAAKTRKNQLAKPAWLPFSDSPNTHFLLVGEGDFSFAVSLAEKFPSSALTATSLDTEAEIKLKYGTLGLENTKYLRELGADVLHGVDATQLAKTKQFKATGYTVVFNFPHLGNSIADQDRNIRQHQELLLEFFKQCCLLNIDRVVLTLFDGMPYEAWQPKQLARSAGLKLERTGRFPWNEFEKYNHQLTGKIGKTNKSQKERSARIYCFQIDKDSQQSEGSREALR